MNSVLNPYLNFDGTAKEAMEFYKEILGGNLDMTTFKQGGMSKNEADENKTMHAMLTTEGGITLMASDTPEGWPYTVGTNMSVSLSGDNEEELRNYWDKLSAGATISQPLEKAPWGDTFGMLTDKFGINWMMNIAGSKA